MSLIQSNSIQSLKLQSTFGPIALEFRIGTAEKGEVHWHAEALLHTTCIRNSDKISSVQSRDQLHGSFDGQDILVQRLYALGPLDLQLL